MRRTKRKELDADVYRNAKAGASPHQLLVKFPGLTFEDAIAAVEIVAEDNKQAGASHRANLRNMIREQAQGALGLIMQLARDESQKPELRLRAAETLLKHASAFIDESVMRSYHERPSDAGLDMQQTIFDFGPTIDEEGAITFTGRPNLRVVNED